MLNATGCVVAIMKSHVESHIALHFIRTPDVELIYLLSTPGPYVDAVSTWVEVSSTIENELLSKNLSKTPR